MLPQMHDDLEENVSDEISRAERRRSSSARQRQFLTNDRKNSSCIPCMWDVTATPTI